MKLIRAGVDVAKSVFQVHAVDRHDQPRWRAKLRRSEWLDALSEHLAPGAEVGMEACASAHHWGRALQARGWPNFPLLDRPGARAGRRRDAYPAHALSLPHPGKARDDRPQISRPLQCPSRPPRRLLSPPLRPPPCGGTHFKLL